MQIETKKFFKSFAYLLLAIFISLILLFTFFPLLYEIANYIIIQGLFATLMLTAFGLFFGFILGIFLALMRIYGATELKWLASGYEKLMRGIPLLVLIYIFIFGMPDLFFYIDLRYRPIAGVILALALRSAAYQSQIFRGAILSVNPGQTEAARALGMTKFQSFRYIVMPQALRLALPAWTNEYAIVIKDSSLAYGVGIVEMTKAAYDFGVAFRELWAVSLGVVTLLYFIFTFPVTRLFGEFQSKKLKKIGLGGEK
ncbi:MAG: amino acid ABC transporter permease [Promethearchaeota archaeon]|nr:MAG: amino acid ABC transporter permease [Candidatus Lokiarchaeota archaeon]